MSLVSEINRTETEKNKTKQVAVNIDNKLIELGGEQAIDLNDVPNKINTLFSKTDKIAVLDINKEVNRTGSKVIDVTVDFSINTANFNVKNIIIELQQRTKRASGSRIEVNHSFFAEKNSFSTEQKIVQTEWDEKVTVKITKWDSNNNLSIQFKGTAEYKEFYLKITKVVCLG